MSSLLALSCLHPDEQILFLIIFIVESSEVLVIMFRKNLILDTVTAEVISTNNFTGRYHCALDLLLSQLSGFILKYLLTR